MIISAMMIVNMNADDKRNGTMVAMINANNYDNHDYRMVRFLFEL